MKKSIKKLVGLALGIMSCFGAVQVQAYSMHDNIDFINYENQVNGNFENTYRTNISPLLEINNVKYVPLKFLELAGYFSFEADDTGKVLYVEDGHYSAQITIGSSLASPYMFFGDLFELDHEVLQIGQSVYVPINFQTYLHNLKLIDNGNSVTMYRNGFEVATLYTSGTVIIVPNPYSTLF